MSCCCFSVDETRVNLRVFAGFPRAFDNGCR